ncbi:hypothetical protein ACIGMX_16200 [Streptomyces aquilus]|uniref:hypothetical protein n=1 Tax=Streptomyces aquilus TaxID=2548456 RepID=UPI0037D82AA3
MNTPTSGHRPTAQPGVAPGPPPPPPASPSALDARTRAVLRAAEDLTTQVRRIADAMSMPGVEHVLAADEVPTTTGDGCTSACHGVTGIRGLLEHVGIDTSDRDITVAGRVAEPAQAADEEQTLRLLRRESLLVLLTRLQRGRSLSETEADALRQHVETEIREANTARYEAEYYQQLSGEQGQALSRADQIRAEAQRDRDQHAAVLKEVLAAFVRETPGYRIPRRSAEVDVVTLDKWRSVVAPTVERPWWETVAEVCAELEQAQAAIERVRETCQGVRDRRGPGGMINASQILGLLSPTWPDGNYEASAPVALDGTEQPTTAAGICTATVGNEDNPNTPVRCVAPAGHYDEANEPTFTEEERNPAGWHTDGQIRVWSDRAATATPHHEQPTEQS